MLNRKTLIFALTVLAGLSAEAATVNNVKGNKAILDISGEDIQEGQQLFLVDDSGKKIGVVKIKQIRGNKALSEVTKGKAVEGATTQSSSSASNDSSNSQRQNNKAKASDKAYGSGKKTRFGGFAGLASNTMSLTAQYVSGATVRSEDVSLKGTSFSAKAYFDYDLSKLFTFRTISGLETFTATGNSTSLICSDGTSTGCSVGFNYLALEGHIQLNYLQGPTRAWLGLGYGFHFTMSKSINIPNLQASGSTNQSILVGTGADFRVGKTSYIPVAFEYGYIPGDNVKSSALYLRAGYGFDF